MSVFAVISFSASSIEISLSYLTIMFIFVGKGGCTPDAALELARYMKQECPHIDLAGLMTIGSFDHDPNAGINPDFKVNC